MCKIKFPTKRIFRIFPMLRIDGMAPFCNLFMERPSYLILKFDLICMGMIAEINVFSVSDEMLRD